MKAFLRENKALLGFLGWAFALLIAWVILDTFFHNAIMRTHYVLIEGQTKVAVWLLEVLHYSVHAEYGIPGYMSWIKVEGSPGVYVGSGCSGLELFLIFAGFILIIKGNLKHKFWFVPTGLAIILLLNIIRISALTIIVYHAPAYLDFNHKYTFVFIVYGAILLLWWWWVKKGQGARSREQGARGREQGVRSKVKGSEVNGIGY